MCRGMPSFGAASRADGDTRLGVSLLCFQDRERRGRGRVRGDIVHHRFTAPLSAWQHLCCSMRNISTNRLLWPEPQTSGDPAAVVPKRFLLLRLEAFWNWCGNPRYAPDRFWCASLQTAVAQTNDEVWSKQSEGEFHEPNAIILIWNYKNAPGASCEWGKKQTHPSWLATNLSNAAWLYCKIERMGGGVGGGRRRCAFFSIWEPRAHRASFRRSLLCESPGHGAQRCQLAPRFFGLWKHGSCQLEDLWGRLFTKFPCKMSAVSFCSTWLLRKCVRCSTMNKWTVAFRAGRDTWSEPHSWPSLFSLFTSHPLYFLFNPFWVTNVAQTCFSAPWPPGERERERLRQAGLGLPPV